MNSIAQNIADFLKEYSPFDKLTLQELSEIAGNIRVVNLQKHKALFQLNDIVHDSFYVVASGVIDLSVIADAEETILNKCHEGAIFGLRPFFAKNNYRMTAKAREESIVYAIPIAVFRPFLANNMDVLNFLLENFATNTPDSKDNENSRGNLISDSVFYTDQQSEMQFFQTLSYNTTPLTTTIYGIVKDVAQLMAETRTNSTIVCENNIPLGIVTDADMSSKIATGRFPVTASVDRIMSSPVITVLENVSLAEAQLLMLKNNVSHLCVTLDGTNATVVKGVISEHDLIIAQASNPGVLIKEIKRSQSAIELKQIRIRLTALIQTSIQKNIPLTHITNLASEINFALLKRAIELSILELGSAPARFAWLSIGSQGRKEQLLLTDQDSILIFEDVADEKYRDVKDYFLKLGKMTTLTLEKVGYELCPNGHMASNMMWCKSLTDWKKQYDSWMNAPGEKNNNISSIFFDYELVYGDQKLENAVSNIVFKNATNNTLFFDYLGNDALRKNAPLTFFKNLNVEEEGPYKNMFDIKTRAIMPLVDGGRLFTLYFDLKGINNTYVRFKQLSISDPKHSEIYLNCAEAFLILSKLSTLEGLKNENSGQYINLEELSRIDKEKLKNGLLPMKELEELIKNKFQLTQFS
ncbi:MAG: CBS domain-containing protein [Psychroserpens sp.]|jgi:CBS domain-containing protein